ncbi:glycosyltransferase family 4 protein [Blastococcus sp. SYSU D00820]
MITSNTLSLGGAERQRVALANALGAGGDAVELRLLQSGGPLESAVDTRLVTLNRVRNYAAVGWPSSPSVIITGTTNTEIMHGWLFKLASKGRAKWIVAVHNPTRGGTTPFSRFVSAGIRAADAVILLSEKQRSDLSHIRMRRVSVIPNGIDVAPYRHARYLTRDNVVLSGPEPPVRLVFIGRLVPQKGLDLLLSALRECLDLAWTLVVVGDGPCRALQTDESFADVLSRVQWHGSKSAEGVLWQSDMLVAPSRNEAYPLVLLEAAAAGLPFVATDVGAVSEIASKAAAVLCDADVRSLAEAIREALAHYPALAAKARMLRESAWENFDRSMMVGGYRALLDRLVGV